MRGFLLDTNVVSELTRSAPNPGVINFLTGQDNLWLSSVVIHELEYGMQLLPQGRRRNRIHRAISAFTAAYDNRILALGRQEAEQAALLRAQARRAGRVLHLGDALIAGTAKAHNLCVATHNVSDFADLDVRTFNPWNETGQPESA